MKMWPDAAECKSPLHPAQTALATFVKVVRHCGKY
jgi:hypothetical protein